MQPFARAKTSLQPLLLYISKLLKIDQLESFPYWRIKNVALRILSYGKRFHTLPKFIDFLNVDNIEI